MIFSYKNKKDKAVLRKQFCPDGRRGRSQKIRSLCLQSTTVYLCYTTSGERPSGSRVGGSRGVYTQSASDKRARERKIIGNKGELLIYNLLCERYGEDHVYPRSEAFVELGILKAGQAISGEYDISYLDENGVEFFVEVKTGSSNSFSISEKELSFAMEFSNKYQLFVVYDLDKEIPQYEEIPMEFWNNANFRRTDIIERIEYHF